MVEEQKAEDSVEGGHMVQGVCVGGRGGSREAQPHINEGITLRMPAGLGLFWPT